jgi:hypothetical protein
MILASLWCDGPGCTATDQTVASGQVTRGDLEQLRHAAAERGWARMRPAGATGYGDYCPRCTAAIRQAREEMRR